MSNMFAFAEQVISSHDNPLFKRLKKLANSARARREARLTLLDGAHLVDAYLDAGGKPATLIRAASTDSAVCEARARLAPSAKCISLPDRLFAELSPVVTPSGLLAEATWLSPDTGSGIPLVVVLEDVRDPGNLGAMLRTAAAAGATRAVLSCGCHDPWSPKALRGGQGAQFVLPVEQGVDLPAWLLRFEGRRLALASGGQESLYSVPLTDPVALIVGNEGAGLSASVRESAGVSVSIPMLGRVESLNAAVALAIALFETLRQRTQ